MQEEADELPQPDGSSSRDLGSLKLLAKLHAARRAIDTGDYEAAIQFSQAAKETDPTSLAPWITHAEACMRLGCLKTFCVILNHLVEHCDELSIADREQCFNQGAEAVERLLIEEHLEKELIIDQVLISMTALQLDGFLEHDCKMLFLQSYARLCRSRVLTSVQYFTYVPKHTSSEDTCRLFMEVHALLKQDSRIIKGMAGLTEPAITAYRLLMSDAAKEAGDSWYAREMYTGAAERYTLALSLNVDNMYAFGGRARCYLHLKKYTEAIIEATTAIEASKPKALLGGHIKDFTADAALTRARAFCDGAAAMRKAPPLRILTSLRALSSQKPEVESLTSRYQALILQYGGVKECGALAASLLGKTHAAPQSGGGPAPSDRARSGLYTQEFQGNPSCPSNTMGPDSIRNGEPSGSVSISHPSQQQPRVQVSLRETAKRAHELHLDRKYLDAAQLQHSMARVTGDSIVWLDTAANYFLAGQYTESTTCALAVLAVQPNSRRALEHVKDVCEQQGSHEKLAEICSELLEVHGEVQQIREMKALAHHKAGNMQAYEKEIEKLQTSVERWRAILPELAQTRPKIGRPKGAERTGKTKARR
ncbi:g6211 [Coccomyxa viridis]|uniref:G6211 protein n=1 Tax=Coccomyxa viridis TaxID=1274662 RepID=A0ABP1FX56_9CHLO